MARSWPRRLITCPWGENMMSKLCGDPGVSGDQAGILTLGSMQMPSGSSSGVSPDKTRGARMMLYPVVAPLPVAESIPVPLGIHEDGAGIKYRGRTPLGAGFGAFLTMICGDAVAVLIRVI